MVDEAGTKQADPRRDQLRELRSVLDTIESGKNAITADDLAALLLTHPKAAALLTKALTPPRS